MISSSVSFRTYEIRLQALSSHPDMPPSEKSDPLFVHTDIQTINIYKQMYIDLHGLTDVDWNFWESGRSLAEFERRGDIKLALVDITDVEMVFRVVDLDSGWISILYQHRESLKNFLRFQSL